MVSDQVAGTSTTTTVMVKPHANVSDFYRELGDLFGVQLSPHNRWAGGKVLRERWQMHIDGALVRPVLVIDEAQDDPCWCVVPQL